MVIMMRKIIKSKKDKMKGKNIAKKQFKMMEILKILQQRKSELLHRQFMEWVILINSDYICAFRRDRIVLV